MSTIHNPGEGREYKTTSGEHAEHLIHALLALRIPFRVVARPTQRDLIAVSPYDTLPLNQWDIAILAEGVTT
jgi:hypothetical protein